LLLPYEIQPQFQLYLPKSSNQNIYYNTTETPFVLLKNHTFLPAHQITPFYLPTRLLFKKRVE
ncbi:MAG: hypothetical protein ACOYER_07355, partial [Limnochordia bacterium]